MKKVSNKESFVFYRSFFEALLGMDKECQADCFIALCDYALNGKEPDLTPVVKMFFTLAKPQVDANNKRFENGCKGGRPKKPNHNQTITETKPNDNQTITEVKPNHNQTITKVEPNDNVNDNDNVNVNDNVLNKKTSKQKKYGELGYVLLREDQYNDLKEKHSNIDLAIEILDTWLGTSGSKNRYKNHYAYFKINSWVWDRVKDQQARLPDDDRSWLDDIPLTDYYGNPINENEENNDENFKLC